MQIYTITHEPPHLPLQSYVYPPPNFSHFPHRAAPFIYDTAPILPCFCHIPVKKPLHTYPPSPTNLRTKHSASAHLRAHFNKRAELLYVDHGAFVPYKHLVDLMSFERLYGGIREKSIEYFQIVYRLFSDGIGQTIRYLPSVAPFPSYKRPITYRLPLRLHPSPDPQPSYPSHAFFAPALRLLPSSEPFPPYKRFVHFPSAALFCP